MVSIYVTRFLHQILSCLSCMLGRFGRLKHTSKIENQMIKIDWVSSLLDEFKTARFAMKSSISPSQSGSEISG